MESVQSAEIMEIVQIVKWVYGGMVCVFMKKMEIEKGHSLLLLTVGRCLRLISFSGTIKSTTTTVTVQIELLYQTGIMEFYYSFLLYSIKCP